MHGSQKHSAYLSPSPNSAGENSQHWGGGRSSQSCRKLLAGLGGISVWTPHALFHAKAFVKGVDKTQAVGRSGDTAEQ